MRKPFIQVWGLAFLIGVAWTAVGRGQSGSKGEVDVILWFDTEDYLSPADDDAAKRLADLLSARQVRATFKVVGEKARVLAARHRDDVIDALKRHDIGYHANFHSVHPTVSEYENHLGLLDGIAEFTRREGPGAEDVRRIFGRKSLVCYGQPGSSWAPQAIAAMGPCGIENDGVPCYLDSGQHVGTGGEPFWYCGALVVYKMKPNETRMELFSAGGLEKAEKEFARIAGNLREKGGGLISIFYHPCEWVTSEFWDGVNFSRGTNPPREQWKLPRQRPKEETDTAFRRFEQYVDFMKSQEDVKFVTASQLPAIYRDGLRGEGVSGDVLLQLARRVADAAANGIDDVRLGDQVFSPADQFDLLSVALAHAVDGPDGGTPVRTRTLLGPGSVRQENDAMRASLPWPAVAMAVRDVNDFAEKNGRIPSEVFAGQTPVPPAVFLVGMARAYVAWRSDARFPENVEMDGPVSVLTERFVAKDDGKLFSGWVIHPTGFRAPHIMEIARLQAWTLKPALRASDKDRAAQ
jgi:hypothetical protein